MKTDDPLLNIHEVSGLLQISATSVWRLVQSKKLEKPIKIGQLARWPRSEVLQTIENAKAARSAAA